MSAGQGGGGLRLKRREELDPQWRKGGLRVVGSGGGGGVGGSFVHRGGGTWSAEGVGGGGGAWPAWGGGVGGKSPQVNEFSSAWCSWDISAGRAALSGSPGLRDTNPKLCEERRLRRRHGDGR